MTRSPHVHVPPKAVLPMMCLAQCPPLKLCPHGALQPTGDAHTSQLHSHNTPSTAMPTMAPWPAVSPTVSPPLPTSKASPVKSLAQNSHLTLRLGQLCWTCSGRSRRLSLALQRLGQGITLKPQVPRWAWRAQGW